MYGFGSKKALIEDFASTALTECAVLVINGYLQSINIKQVLLLGFYFIVVRVSLAFLHFSRIISLVAMVDIVKKHIGSVHWTHQSKVTANAHILELLHCHCFY